MKDLQDRTAAVAHRYQQATGVEKKTLFEALQQDRSANQLAYKQRFLQGTNPKRPPHLRFSPDSFQKDALFIRAPFHEGLLKDEQGIYWIVKKFNPQAREDLEPRVPRNCPRYERLAYLLAKGHANYAEIRLLTESEVHRDGAFPGRMKDFYLSRVATSGNMDASILPQTDPADAFTAIFVANVFTRKWDQHLNNFAYVGATPVCIDHDVIGPPATFPHSGSGISMFNLAFLSFKMVSMLSYLRPPHDVDEHAKERLKHYFVRQNDREAWWIMRDLIHGLGLGAGLIHAEGLLSAGVRRCVRAFKEVPAIGRLAEEAGFQGKERETIVRYLTQSQKDLGTLVGQIWQHLTGENARLDQLD